MISEIIFATGNQHKLDEVGRMLQPLGIDVISGSNLPDVAETGTTFEENALIKALAGVKAAGKPVIAEDSGISIKGLDGAPGIYAARFAKEHGGYSMEGVFGEINRRLQGKSDRTAFYTSVIVLAISETEYYTFKGYMHGTIAEQSKGVAGFGYDPIFIPKGQTQTLAELPETFKHEQSHRRESLDQLLQFLKEQQ